MKKLTGKARLDDLERRVRELEARPPVTVQPVYIPAPPTYYPWWGIFPPQPYVQPSPPFYVPIITYSGQITIHGNDAVPYGTFTASHTLDNATPTLSVGTAQ